MCGRAPDACERCALAPIRSDSEMGQRRNVSKDHGRPRWLCGACAEIDELTDKSQLIIAVREQITMEYNGQRNAGLLCVVSGDTCRLVGWLCWCRLASFKLETTAKWAVDSHLATYNFIVRTIEFPGKG